MGYVPVPPPPPLDRNPPSGDLRTNYPTPGIVAPEMYKYVGSKGLIAELRDILVSIKWLFGFSATPEPVQICDYSQSPSLIGTWRDASDDPYLVPFVNGQTGRVTHYDLYDPVRHTFNKQETK